MFLLKIQKKNKSNYNFLFYQLDMEDFMLSHPVNRIKFEFVKCFVSGFSRENYLE